MTTSYQYSLKTAIFVSIGLLVLFLAVQLATFAVVDALVSGTTGFKAAVATTLGSLIMLVLTYGLAKKFAKPYQLLGLTKFHKKHLTGALSLLVMFMLVGSVLENFSQSSPIDFMNDLLDESSFWLLILLVVVIAPIYEELMFRGFMMGLIANASTNYRRKTLWLIASLVSTLAFTLIHFQYDWFGLLLIFVLSLILSWARLISGSVILPMILHFLNNSVAMVVYLLR